jgi:hypothetical protein
MPAIHPRGISLVDVEGLHLIIALPELLVLAHKYNLRHPRQRKCRNRERRRRAQSNNVAGFVGLRPKVWGPDERSVHDGRHDTDGNSLLLGCLATGGSAPSENQGVDAVCSDGEDDHSGVAACDADGGACDKKTDGGDTLGDCDVPGALVELTRRPGDCDGDCAGDQVGWACKDEGDELGETQSFDDGREEVLEPIGWNQN